MSNPLIEEAHARLAVALRPGAAAIDATVDKGHDTLRLWFREKHRSEGIIEERRSEPESPEAPFLLLASKFSSGQIN